MPVKKMNKYLIYILFFSLVIMSGCATFRAQKMRDTGFDQRVITAEPLYIMEDAAYGGRSIVNDPESHMKIGYEVIGMIPKGTIFNQRHLIYANSIMGDVFVYHVKDLGFVADKRLFSQEDIPYVSGAGVAADDIVNWVEMDTETYLKRLEGNSPKPSK